jgi:uncharacterized alpha-E superfamily protein
MLSRVADALFWMSRYLERAEHVARLLDVCFHNEIDLHGVITGPHELPWDALAATLQVAVPEATDDLPAQVAFSRSLSFNLGNSMSIMSSIGRARYNARSIRGTINSEIWKAINKLYWQLSDPAFLREAQQSPHEFYLAVENGSHLVQGICDATLIHNEGWQFIQLGKFLERADKTVRILDAQYRRLHELTDPANLPLSNLQWAAVLRSCRAYEAYQGLYVGRVESERVIEFLLLHPGFPRSVLFSLEQAANALAEIEALGGDRTSAADRILGRVLSDLRFGEADQIIERDLHAFLGSVLERCAQVASAVQTQYALR